MISNIVKFVFIHIPKCAGTSIESSLSQYSDTNTIGYNKKLKGHTQHAVCKELIDLNLLTKKQETEYFKFTIVRNPWERCISEYTWRIKQYGNFINGPINVNNGVSHENYTKEYVRKNVSFEDFLTRNFPWQELSFEQHMKPQIEYIYDSNGSKIDYIGRFENLNQDFDVICKRLFKKRISLPHKFKSNHTNYTQYYNKKTIDIVGDMYLEDIKYFKYKFGE